MSGSGSTCNRCQQSGLGWCISRATRRHYLAWLVPTPVVAPDGVTIVSELKPQPNLLHKCGANWTGPKPQTIEDARREAAEYAAERARTRALAQSPQPIAQPVQAPAKPARKVKAAAKSTAAVGAVSVTDKTGTALPFGTGAVHVPTADVPGKIESQVALRNALVQAGYAAIAADALAASLTPLQIAELLLAASKRS